MACLPVVTLGFGAALTHLLRAEAAEPDSLATAGSVPDLEPVSVPAGTAAVPASAAVSVPEGANKPVPVARATTAKSTPNGRAPGAPEAVFAADIVAGSVPSIRAIKARCRVGTPRAREIREHLASLTVTATA